ncbi:MAG TPA: helix-turn-helix domain-containing protein [Dehalococcoidia bacterium]|nr:helix-turn-helix domain-containing protein [Dehalococcoidia bacterium]
MADELLLKVGEVARRLGFGKSLVYRLIRDGELRSVRIGGARRVLVAELNEFIQRLKERRDEESAVI